jgi:hypothetical protein
VGGYGIGITVTRGGVAFGEFRPFPGNTFGLYSSVAIGGYCPIDLKEIVTTPLAPLTMRTPFFTVMGNCQV